jgi:hypothetical protein
MKILLKLEDAAELILSVFLFTYLDFAWWYYPALLLLPDLSMIGYLFNTSVGAILYNIAHHKGTAITIGIIGFVLTSQGLLLAGIIFFGHTAMDRLLGYGLKYSDNFQHTHLGRIGKQ